MKRLFNWLLIGIAIGVILGYAWHYFAVKDKLEVYKNYEQMLKQKDTQILNYQFRSELCCGYIKYVIKKGGLNEKH
jgi:Tfp pilus assembly protein PilO